MNYYSNNTVKNNKEIFFSKIIYVIDHFCANF